MREKDLVSSSKIQPGGSVEECHPLQGWHCRHSTAVQAPLAVPLPWSLPARTGPVPNAPAARTPPLFPLPHGVSLSAFLTPTQNPSSGHRCFAVVRLHPELHRE